MKFRIKKVNRFTYGGKSYVPGDIVDLPDSYLGMDFTELVDAPKSTTPLPEPEILPLTAAIADPKKAEPKKKSRSSAGSRA